MTRMRRWMHQTTGGLPRAFWFLWTNLLINRIGSFVVIVLAIYLTRQRGFSETYAGLVLGLWGAGGAVGTLVGGVLADRWGRKPTLLSALYVSSAVMIVLGLTRGPVLIAVVVTLLGVVSEMSRPAMSAFIIDIVAERERLRAFSLNYWVINLGFAFAAATAGFVADVDYLLLFAINAATIAAGATVVAVAVSEPPRTVRTPTPTANANANAAKPSLRIVFSDKVFMAYVGVNVLLSVVFMQHISTLPMAMSKDGLSASTFGTVIALNGVLIVAGQLFVPRLIHAWDRSTALAVAAIIVGVGFGMNALADNAWMYALAVLVWTVGEMLNAPSNSATNAELSPAHMRGRYQGVFSLSWSVASFLAPVVGAAVLQYAGATVLWVGCFVVSVVIAGLHLWAGPSRSRRIAELRDLSADTPLPAHPAAAAPSSTTRQLAPSS